MKAKEIQIKDIWNDKKRDNIRKAILSHSASQSKEVVLTSRLLAIQYKLEDYIQNEDDSEVLKILDFVKMYLKALSLTKKELANYFEMRDSNLHKYLSGERIIRDLEGNDTGVREDEMGAMYINHRVFFSIPRVIEIIEQLKNSQLVKDIRKRKLNKK